MRGIPQEAKQSQMCVGRAVYTSFCVFVATQRFKRLLDAPCSTAKNGHAFSTGDICIVAGTAAGILHKERYTVHPSVGKLVC